MGIFYFPVKIVSAEGCLSSLGNEIERLGSKNPLIITDSGIVKAGILDKVIPHLKNKNISYAVFDGVEPDPKIHNVNAAVNIIKKGGYDILIGLGGGSSIDTAKAASILSTNEVDLREYQGVREGYPKNPLPIITIPTTAGTGSEVSSAAVIVDEEKRYKMFFKSPQIFSRVTFLDADVLVGIPSPIAAVTGADTLTHAFESFINPNRTPFSEMASLVSIELIFKNLRAFVANTKNKERAQNMLNASSLAGIAMTTAGLGLAHALAHPLGVRGKISHGLACALLLPHVLRFNWIVEPDQFMRLASVMDWTIRLEYLREEEIVLHVIESVENLLRDIDIPKSLSEIQVYIDDTSIIIDEAYNSFLNQVNPRPASRNQVEEILKNII